MTESVAIQHPPAVKVGGRRLSVSKHRAPQINTTSSTSSNEANDNEPEPPLDYPRPTPDAPHSPLHHRNDEEPPKNNKKQGYTDKKLREYAHVKSESTRPTKDNTSSKKGTAGIRISQPEGKAFGI